MFRDVVFVNGAKAEGYTFQTIEAKARLLGQPYHWAASDWGKGGFGLVYLDETGSVHIQEIELMLEYDPSSPYPHTLYLHTQYASLAEARASGFGWLVEYALGNE